ncbi:hypothetical protein [Sphingomonas sp.]|uniref:hypothetical protein n=1 Tax=Sphingomonas sp. TaxID=28214 RepID=UPI0031D28FF1
MTEAIIRDPQWFPHRFDAARRQILFVRLTREQHRAAAFLDDRHLGEGLESRAVSIDAIDADAVPAGRLHFIFHSAFCCSTLLAAALDVPGRVFALKEPVILNDVALVARRGLDPRDLDRILALLARPFAPGEIMVAKPGNEANTAIPSLLTRLPAARALLMSSPIEGFLGSVANKGMWGRLWGRRVYAGLRPFQPRDPGYSDSDLLQQTDLQIAALVWLAHRGQFAELSRIAPGRYRGLLAEDLLANRARALTAISDWFELGMSAAEIAAIADGPVFQRNAKRADEHFDEDARAANRARAESAHGEEIAMVGQWAGVIADQVGLPRNFAPGVIG